MITLAQMSNHTSMTQSFEKSSEDEYKPQEISVYEVLRILHEDLFYQNMVKLKIESTNIDSEVITHLVNNRPTYMNKRVITAALILFASQKMRYT